MSLLTAWWTYLAAGLFLLLLWAALSIAFAVLFNWFATRIQSVSKKSPKVDQVDVGLGPELWRFELSGTAYLFHLIPIALTVKGYGLASGGIAASLSFIPLSLLFVWLAIVAGSVGGIDKIHQGPVTVGVADLEKEGTAAREATLNPLPLFGKAVSAMWRPIDEKPNEWRYLEGKLERSGFFGAATFVFALLSAAALLLSGVNIVAALFQIRSGALVLIVASSLVPGFSVASRLFQAASYFLLGLFAFTKTRDDKRFWVAFLGVFVVYQFYGIVFTKYYVGLVAGLIEQFSWAVQW